MPSEFDVKSLSTAENLGLGTVAGTIEVVLLQPLLYCKNAVQQGVPLTLNPLVLYRGVSVSVINMAVLTGAQFPLSGAIARLITGGSERPLSSGEKVASGFAGGVISGFICAPMELVMIQQQRFGGSLTSTASRIVSEFGVSTLFRGLTTSCGREGLFCAGYLGVGPMFAQMLRERQVVDGSVADFAGASGAGMIAATLSHPLDTMKTCMQGDIERKVYTDQVGTFRKIAEGGYGNFLKGWSLRTGRMICAIFLIGQVKNRLGPLMYPHAVKPTAAKS